MNEWGVTDPTNNKIYVFDLESPTSVPSVCGSMPDALAGRGLLSLPGAALTANDLVTIELLGENANCGGTSATGFTVTVALGNDQYAPPQLQATVTTSNTAAAGAYTVCVKFTAAHAVSNTFERVGPLKLLSCVFSSLLFSVLLSSHKLPATTKVPRRQLWRLLRLAPFLLPLQ